LVVPVGRTGDVREKPESWVQEYWRVRHFSTLAQKGAAIYQVSSQAKFFDQGQLLFLLEKVVTAMLPINCLLTTVGWRSR
jgi:hypothetical protein